MLDKILSFLANYLTTKSTNLTASNWTSSKADFVSGNLSQWGQIRALYLQVKTNATIAAGEEATLGTLTNVTTTGMVNGVGTGVGIVSALNTGVMRQQTHKALSEQTNIYIRFWWRA